MKSSLIKTASLIVCLTCLFILFIPRSANSQKGGEIEESLQEFFIGETVYAQKKHETQLTSKPSFWKKEGLQIISIPIQVEYGFTDRFQVELSLPYHFLFPKVGQNVNGIGNTEAGFLYALLKDKKLALSVALNVGLPTANKTKNIDDPEVEWEPSLIVARQIGRAQLHAALSASLTKNESEFNYNLSTVVPFGDWRATLELNGKINEGKMIYLTPGLLWKGLEDFEIGLGASGSILEKTGGWGIVVMATFEF